MVLSDCHHGFRPGFSAERVLTSTTKLWLSSVNSRNSICSVFLISTKVFDSIIYQPLLNILSSYKFHILIIDWLNIHLHFKWRQVVFKGSASSKTPANSGVPQDSILCPLFFILYVNEIVSLHATLNPNTTLTLYADNILLSSLSKSNMIF